MDFTLFTLLVYHIVRLCVMVNCDKLTGEAGVRFEKYRRKERFSKRLPRIVTLSQLITS